MKNLTTFISIAAFFAACFGADAVMAQNCAIPPSCEELGYDQNGADIKSKKILCPLDKTKAANLKAKAQIGDYYAEGGYVTANYSLVSANSPIGVVISTNQYDEVRAVLLFRYSDWNGVKSIISSGVTNYWSAVEGCARRGAFLLNSDFLRLNATLKQKIITAYQKEEGSVSGSTWLGGSIFDGKAYFTTNLSGTEIDVISMSTVLKFYCVKYID